MCKAASFVVTKDKVFWSKKTDSHEDIIREFGLSPEVAGKICVLRCEIVPPINERYDLPAKDWIYKTDQQEDKLPEWFDAVDVEKRCRESLSEWIKARVFVGVECDIHDTVAFAFKASKVAACGSSKVTARGSSTVAARDSSTVTAWDSSTVTALGSSTVTAWESSTVTARDSSTVTALGSSTVTAWESSTVTARDSSTVTAWDSSTVTALGSSTVTALGSSTVTARDSSTVAACKSRATVIFYCAFKCRIVGERAVIINRIGAKAKTYIGRAKARTVEGK
jgi:hypothetical protein